MRKQLTTREAKVFQDKLKSIFEYNPETGVFTWKIETGGKKRVGTIAGFIHIGRNGKQYRLIRTGEGKQHYAQRLAWIYVHGFDPHPEVDHKNGISVDNRIENLRVVSHAENSRNRKRPSTNKSGVCGVCKFQGKFMAQISYNGDKIYLGLFKTIEEAAVARRVAEIEYGYDPQHGKDRSY